MSSAAGSGWCLGTEPEAAAGPDVVPCVQQWPRQTGPVHDFSWVLEPPFLVPGSPASLLTPGRIPSSLSVRSGAPLLVLPGTSSLSVLSCFPHQTNSPQTRDHVFVHFSTPAPSPQPKKMLLFLNECLTLWEQKQPGRVLTRRPHPAGRLKG